MYKCNQTQSYSTKRLIIKAFRTSIILHNIEIKPHLEHLLKFLVDNKKVKKIEGANKSILHIISDDLLEMIELGITGWEKFVPKKIELAIKDKELFGYIGYKGVPS